MRKAGYIHGVYPLERSSVRDAPVRHGGVIAETAPFILRLREQACCIAQKRAQLAPAVCSVAAVGVARAEGDGALVEEEMDVFCGGPGGVGVGV